MSFVTQHCWENLTVKVWLQSLSLHNAHFTKGFVIWLWGRGRRIEVRVASNTKTVATQLQTHTVGSAEGSQILEGIKDMFPHFTPNQKVLHGDYNGMSHHTASWHFFFPLRNTVNASLVLVNCSIKWSKCTLRNIYNTFFLFRNNKAVVTSAAFKHNHSK